MKKRGVKVRFFSFHFQNQRFFGKAILYIKKNRTFADRIYINME